jgi:hypothetical protein
VSEDRAVRIERAVDDYLGELAREGRTKATRHTYRRVLYGLLDTLPRELPVEELRARTRRHDHEGSGRGRD